MPSTWLWVVGLWAARLGSAAAQTVPSGIPQALASYTQRAPTEKLFLHLDRPCYVSGETMWFAVYAVDGASNQPLAASSIAYVEVLDREQRPMAQGKIGLRQARGQGSFVLPVGLASGQYTVRAYTNWMKNFGPALYFQSQVAIVNTRTPVGPSVTPAAATYDPQFFPEGGYLVQGLTSKVGFKITDEHGKGVAAEGTILDQAGQVVGIFRTRRFGLGSFSFTPTAAGAAYTAVIRLGGQQTITRALPPVQAQGYVLHLADAGPEQVRVVVQASGAGLLSEPLFLLAHTRQQVAFAAEAPVGSGQVQFLIEKKKLAAGITHFTLFNSRRQPLCERLYFRAPTSSLALTARTDKTQYASREPVRLQLSAALPPGASQTAAVSVAVYQLDSLSAAGGSDISSYLWLASDVKGPIESPAYYLAASDTAVAADADNLMLTQGWSRFTWAEVLAEKPAPLAYLPELNGPIVRGRVVHRSTGAPVAGIPVYLTAPSRAIRLHTAISKPDGSLVFELPALYGPKRLLVQPNLQRDSLYQVELLNPFSEQYTPAPKAPFTLPERLAASLRRRHVQAEVQQHYFGNRPIVYQTPVTDSVAFYGKPDERYLLDTYTRFKVMEEVMREYVPGVLVRIRKDGFHFLVPDDNARTTREDPLVLLDGMPVFNTNQIMAFDPLKVQKLDVVTKRYFVGPIMYNGIVSYTTYKGDLAGFPLDPRVLLQEYEGVQGQREFYAPRYDTPQQAHSRLPDFRNLLYWNPAVSLTAGSAPELTFFTSDQVGTYRVVVQGLSSGGSTGSATYTFDVKPAL